MSTLSSPTETIVHAAVAGERSFTARDLWRLPRVGGPVPSPDGRCCVVPVTTWTVGAVGGVTRMWIAPTDGSAARPLTDEQVNVAAPAWSPDGSALAVVGRPAADHDALWQLDVIGVETGETERVTELPLGVIEAHWLPDGSGLVLAAALIKGHATVEATRAEQTRRDDDPVKAHATEDRLARFWDRWLTGGEVPHLFHLDLATGALRDLTPDSVAWFDFMEPRGQFDVSPDGREVVFAGIVVDDERNEIESRIFLAPVGGGDVRCLTPQCPAGAIRPRFAPDGSSIVYGRKEDRYFYADRARLYRMDRASETHSAWCADWDQAPTQWEFAADGTLVFVAEHRARTHLYALDAEASTPRRLAEGGTLGSPRPAANGRVYIVGESMHEPPEVRCCPQEGGSLERITSFTADVMSGIALGEVREIEVAGAEGEPVQSFVVLPPGHVDGTPAPFVNMVHGGPHGITGDGFHVRWNAHLFAAPGYVVAMPNFQGSTSWGTDYAARIQGAWADRPFRDVMAVTDTLVASGLVDEKRMSAVGGSYGGYMMAWIAGHTDRFRCIVNHAGVYNTLNMYASDNTQGRPRSFGGEPWDGIEAIDRWNPARHIANMSTPMLVIHGEKDYRVPVGQGLECYGVLRAKGVPARLLYFPDENHWILKAHNSLRWYDEVHSWLGRWIES